MSRYFGAVRLDFWERIRNCSTAAKVIATYYLTGRPSNALGLFLITRGTIAFELNLKPKEVALAEAELEQLGFMRRCLDTQVVWLPGHLGDYPPQNPKVWKHVDGLTRLIPQDLSYLNDLLNGLSPYLNHLPGLVKRFENRLGRRNGKPYTQTVSPKRMSHKESEPESDKSKDVQSTPGLKGVGHLQLLPQMPGAHGRVDFSDSQNRNCFAHAKVLPVLEQKLGNVERAWLTINAARDKKNPDHEEADKLCRMIAKDLNVIWDSVPERSAEVSGGK